MHRKKVHQLCCISLIITNLGVYLSGVVKGKDRPPDLVTENHELHLLSSQSGRAMSKLRSSTQLRLMLSSVVYYPQKAELRQ